MLKSEKPNFNNKEVKSKITMLDKQNLYSEWKVSRLSKPIFCKKKKLALSTFSRWCQVFSCSEVRLSLKKSTIKES